MNITQHLRNEVLKTQSHIPLSGVTSYHLLSGSLTLDNGVTDTGMATTLYTGNGTTQAVATGVDMTTQWGNLASEKFGGLVWVKGRSGATNNFLYDTVRGVTKEINSNTTEAEATLANSLTTFNSTGFSVGSDAGQNTNLATYASWNFQTTHQITGTTNHGKAYTCHYNPFTGFTIVKYEGSGLAGHEIPHHLGRKLGFVTTKNLSAVSDWLSGYRDSASLYLNLTNAEVATATFKILDNCISTETNALNTSTNQYIIYGWADSYFDEASTLIGNYEVGIYQGTGVAGNKVTTRGKPAWVMVKSLNSTGNWVMMDNIRGDKELYTNLSNAEDSLNYIDIVSDGFTVIDTAAIGISGGQYLYMVVYDNDSGSGKSKYPRATDTSNLNLNAVIPFGNGVDANGSLVTTLTKNETVSGLTLTQGKNYIWSDNTGAYGVTPYRPRYSDTDLVANSAGDNPNYFDVRSGIWYSTVSNPELVTNGTFNTDISGWAATLGTAVLDNRTLKFTANASVSGYVTSSITTVIGETYAISFTAYCTSDNQVYLRVGTNGLAGEVLYKDLIGSGASQSYTFIAQATTTYINFRTDNTRVMIIDNVSVFKKDIELSTVITNSRNYLDAIVYADQNGQPTYVEQLPKTEYKDVIKANEYQGKNACTAWVNFDGTTTPPTIRDSFNVKAVIRTATGQYDIYFDKPMDNVNYIGVSGASGTVYATTQTGMNQLINGGGRKDPTLLKCTINVAVQGITPGVNAPEVLILIFGGKN